MRGIEGVVFLVSVIAIAGICMALSITSGHVAPNQHDVAIAQINAASKAASDAQFYGFLKTAIGILAVLVVTGAVGFLMFHSARERTKQEELRTEQARLLAASMQPSLPTAETHRYLGSGDPATTVVAPPMYAVQRRRQTVAQPQGSYVVGPDGRRYRLASDGNYYPV